MFRSVRSSTDERYRRLPGDELLPKPSGSSLTHAITIRRPPHEVWPWLAQMGAGRAGWYSYDVIDNGRQPSAERILPEFQGVEVGGIFPALPGVTDDSRFSESTPSDCWFWVGCQQPAALH